MANESVKRIVTVDSSWLGLQILFSTRRGSKRAKILRVQAYVITAHAEWYVTLALSQRLLNNETESREFRENSKEEYIALPPMGLRHS